MRSAVLTLRLNADTKNTLPALSEEYQKFRT